MTRVKLCGFTDAAGIRAAVEAGADAIGLNIARGPRRIDPAHAAALARGMPPFVAAVVLAVDQDAELVLRTADACRAAAVQLHGDEEPAYAARIAARFPVIKAFRVRSRGDLDRAAAYPCDALLLDAFVAGAHGGTGQAWDPSLLAGWTAPVPWILAGGLTPATVAGAIAACGPCRPWAVDAASGVESAPAVKDPALMRAFVSAVR